MNAETWARVKEIFSEVIELDPDLREKRLAEACGDDLQLRTEVEALLRSNDEVEGFIEEPAFAIADAIPPDIEPSANKQIGHYRIVREIGRGGMGTVFLATRDDGEFQQEVAIKIVSSAFLGRENLRRFRQERQILAELSHPNIARLLDGGVTDDGLPFLVMEYVEGEPLVEFAEKRSLTVEERLRLFQQICRAVAYAHAKLIVHRDIKPSNILVTSDGEIKLLDFGLAKFLDIESGDITATNFRALTPAYASPEQIRGQPLTTSSDVFSLGVVLYELLTGSRPFNYESMSIAKLIETVSDSEPVKPSSKALAMLNRDIDNIVMMAMRTEVERRYRSADQLADDIERHLNGLPVSATEDTFLYRASKFVTRHRFGIASATGLVLILITGIVATLWQARVAMTERDKAQLENEKVEQLNDYLQSILSAAAPEKMGKDAKVIDVLDDAARRLDEELLAGQPELRARALSTIGETYVKLGLLETAESKLRSAVAFYDGESTAPARDGRRARKLLAECLIGEYKFDEAAAILSAVIDAERSLGPGSVRDLYESLFMLGESKVRTSDYSEAEALLKESISLCESLGTEMRFDCAYAQISLGRARQFSGDLDTAEDIFRKSLAVLQLQPTRYPLRIADLSVNLGDLLVDKDDSRGGLDLLLTADAIYERELGSSYQLVISKYYAGRAYLELNDNASASKFAGDAVEIARKLDWVNNRNFVGALALKGLALTRLDKAGEGETLLREALHIAEKHLAAGDPRIANVRSSLGECLTKLRRFKEAERMLLAALSEQELRLPPNSKAISATKQRLTDLRSFAGPRIIRQ